MAQVQIFLTLLASIGLRLEPREYAVATITTVLLFAIIPVSLFMETNIFSNIQTIFKWLKERVYHLQTGAIKRDVTRRERTMSRRRQSKVTMQVSSTAMAEPIEQSSI